MRELLERFGLMKPLPEIHAAEQVTVPRQILTFGGMPSTAGNRDPRKLRRDWRTLLKLSETTIASRAISLIVNKVASLDYVIEPAAAQAQDDADYSKQIDTIRTVLDHPNLDDTDFPTFIRRIVEDQLTFDMGAWEYVEAPAPAIGPNNILSLIPVPGWSLERTLLWKGDTARPRWVQMGPQTAVPLLDSQIEAIIMRNRTSSSYGLSPLEVALSIMEAYLKLSSYQANVASETYPAFLISLGNSSDQTLLDRFYHYWRNDLEGRGRPGVVAGMDDPKSIQLKAITDDGLYLKYHEILVRTFAFAFGLKGQDFNIERDVNKNQGQISQAASIEEAIRPYAVALSTRVTRRIIPRIATLTNDPKMLELIFRYSNIDPWDEMEQTNLATVQWQADGLTRNEYRKKIGLPPVEDGTGEMSYSEYTSQYGGSTPGEIINVKDDSTQKSAEAVDDPRHEQRQQLLQLLATTRRKKKR